MNLLTFRTQNAIDKEDEKPSHAYDYLFVYKIFYLVFNSFSVNEDSYFGGNH